MPTADQAAHRLPLESGDLIGTADKIRRLRAKVESEQKALKLLAASHLSLDNAYTEFRQQTRDKLQDLQDRVNALENP